MNVQSKKIVNIQFNLSDLNDLSNGKSIEIKGMDIFNEADMIEVRGVKRD